VRFEVFMLDSGFDLVAEFPACLAVLKAYASELKHLSDSASSEPAAAVSQGDSGETEAESAELEAEASDGRRRRWLPRVPAVDGINAEDLSRAHGRLIAHGFLKCDLADCPAGIVYQLTPEGRQILARTIPADETAAA